MGEESRHPLSVWSSAAYLMSGMYALATAELLLGYSFGVALVLLGICSGIFHRVEHLPWKRRHLAQGLEEVGTYWVLSFALFIALAKVNPSIMGANMALGLALVLGAVLMVDYKKADSFFIIPALSVAVLLVTTYINVLLGVGLSVVFVASVTMRQLGVSIESKSPAAADAMHGLWHMGTAAGLLWWWHWLADVLDVV